MEHPGKAAVRDAGAEAVAAGLEAARKDVLDLSLRNPLLNFRPSKRLGLRIVGELSREVFRTLAGSGRGRTMYFLPAPEAATHAAGDAGDGEIPSELLRLLATPESGSGPPADHQVDNRLQTEEDTAGLARRLRETFRQARSSIEEQGVNTLYLALGFLRWRESEESGLDRAAPLILVPVRLDRTDVRQTFRLRWTGDEIEPNLSLAAKLRADFGIRLPELPPEESLEVEAYLGEVARAVERQPGWSVDTNSIHLAFFSFSKFLIYKDLDPDQWPEDEQPGNHPVLGALLGRGGFRAGPPPIGDGEKVDGHPRAVSLRPVVDADSSQTLAVVDAMAGRNLVIQGPPGTGKSQTITNLVGEALAGGKTVLFVAEKMAALEVVKRRLDTIHLGDTCLELHSHNTNKRAVLDELKRTLELGRPKAPAAVHHEILRLRRRQLNEYARAVNSPVARSGLTPHVLVGKLEQLKAGGLKVDGPGLRCGGSVSWSRRVFAYRRALVSDIERLVRKTGRPRDHLFWGTGLLDIPFPAEETRIRESLEGALAELRGLRTLLNRLGSHLLRDERPGDSGPSEAERLLRMAAMSVEASGLIAADHRSGRWVRDAPALEALAKDAESYADLHERWGPRIIPDAWDADVLATRQALAAYGTEWWRFASGVWRRAVADLRGLCRTELPRAAEGRLALVDGILESQRLRRGLEGSRDLVDALFPGLAPGRRPERYRELARAAEWYTALHAEKAAGRIDGRIHDILDQAAPAAETGTLLGECRERRERLEAALERVAEAIELRPERFAPGERPFRELDRWLEEAAARVGTSHDIVRFNQFEKEAMARGIPEVAVAAASLPDAGRHLVHLFEHGCYSAWLESALRERDALARFDGATHAGVAAEFRELDRAQFESNRVHIAGLHWDGLPRHRGGGQLAVLRREFQKKSRHLPVRTLMQNAGSAIQAIKPVFMMSPLSIAKYIPPGSVSFDMVVFDEASQVRPTEAMGAILRGRQSVVVGDSKQLPPTSFFDVAGGEAEDDSETADLESILGMFCAKSAPDRMLRWHYRSRHESLIAVSNHEFYDNRLIVFPSPDGGREETGLRLVHNPDNRYRGGGVNIAEARAVAAAIMEHARTTPNLTLGAVAFSLKQARRIEDEVEILRRHDPSLEASFFAQHPDEPFFVKNLENVQGDERDVILISIGYGKDRHGIFRLNFGPLNRDGGERRLNVLITRARLRCTVYSNFLAADVDRRRSKALGVQTLRTFLKYAATGVLDVPRATGREADSPFEEAVGAALRARGHEIEHQVGTAGFFVDLAVLDPGRPGRFILGIECDGAMYHSARSARDRDRLRQQVLEGLGWTIHRIWSTDWFRSPERELARVEAAIRSAATDNGGSPRAVARPEPAPMERTRAPVPPEDIRSIPYEVAKLHIGRLGQPLHEVSTAQLAGWIRRVVEVESPVHLGQAIARVREAARVARAGARIRRRMEEAVRAGQRAGFFERRGDFLWRTGHGAADVRNRSGRLPDSASGVRSIEMIAPEEIGQALHHAVRDSFGITEVEAVKEAWRLFGFRRAGANTTQRFRDVVGEMVKAGALTRSGGLLRVPDAAGS
ncbi:MAG: DUF3320 domain-containing protein [Gammaproteobacteria bacterium]|nr:DUF3320 domain-containing protein [Gammaproteobacteria bacterium]MDE0247191.1 DUF3320 domain-containing protein [Gammaproteobacteria bacterium]